MPPSTTWPTASRPLAWEWSGAAPVRRETDLPALTDVQYFGLFALTGVGLEYFTNFVLGPVYNFSVFGASGTSPGAIDSSALLGLGSLTVLGAALSAAAIYCARQGFVRLRSEDPRFSTPATLALLAIVGILVLVLGLAVLFSSVAALLQCAGGTTPVPARCVNVGALLGGVALLFVGAVLGLIGLIGTVLGLWRLGDRYDNSLLKAGAVLWIFPILNLVGVLLILLALREVRHRLAPAVGYAPPTTVGGVR